MAFKKSVNITGKYKSVFVDEEMNFVDLETGESIDLAENLRTIYGDNAFSISTSFKDDVDLD